MTSTTTTSKTKESAMSDNDNDGITANHHNKKKETCICLNESKSPLDKKLYRYMIVPQNGLRVLLIQDTNAMHQLVTESKYDHLHDEEDDDDDDEDDVDNDNKQAKEEVVLETNSASSQEEEEDGSVEDGDEEEEGGIRKAAAAMVVGTGSFMDPMHCQGLAHFCEHMLFMGTTKYPVENSYDQFLTQHGGSDNAFTEYEHTVYYFDIPQEFLGDALDRFAQFFISPLFDKSSVEREIRAIESEFQLSKNSDGSRLERLMQHTGRRTHPQFTFSWGNHTSLVEEPLKNNVNILDELQTFFDQFYYATNMRLVVMGAYELDVLEEEVLKWFSDVPSQPRQSHPLQWKMIKSKTPSTTTTNSSDVNKKKDDTTMNGCPKTFASDSTEWNANNIQCPLAEIGMPFGDESTGKLYRMVPVKDRHFISITWQIPSQKQYWKSKPYDLLAHLLGHESRGSLLSVLKQGGRRQPDGGSHDESESAAAVAWVTSCTAGIDNEGYTNASCYSLFNVSFTLTKEGVAHWKQVVQYVYMYIGMLRYYLLSDDKKLPQYIFDELKTMLDLSYRYQEEESPDDFVEAMAERMSPENDIHCPPQHLLNGQDLLFCDTYDTHQLTSLLDEYFSQPHQARYDLSSSFFGRAKDYEQPKEEEPNKNLKGDDVVVPQEEEKQQQEPQLDPVPGCDVLDYFHVVGEESTASTTTGDDEEETKTISPPPPLMEPYFGTRYWIQNLSDELLEEWKDAAQPSLPPSEIPLALPLENPFVPKNLTLKPRPLDDTHHPLLHCSLKVLSKKKKKKEWFPATVVKYNALTNMLELVYEDLTSHFHTCDIMTKLKHSHTHSPNEFHCSTKHTFPTIHPDMEGTFDNSQTKYRVIHVAKHGETGTIKYGDETDFYVDAGLAFPSIPPPTPSSRLPRLVVDDKGIKLWHLQDTTKFHRPIGELRIQIICGNANASPLERCCADLMAALCRDTLEEVTYQASCCELGSSLKSTDLGFSIRVHGFDDRLLTLTNEILKVFFSFRHKAACATIQQPQTSTTMTDPEDNDDDDNGNKRKDSLSVLPDGISSLRFDACKEVLMRSYENASLKAGKLCSDVRLRTIRPTIWSSHSKLNVLQHLSTHKFMSVVTTFMEFLNIECLFHGNVTTDDAKEAHKMIYDVKSLSLMVAAPSSSSSTTSNSYGGILTKKKQPLQPVLQVIPSYATLSNKNNNKSNHTSSEQRNDCIVVPTLDVTEPNTAVEIYFQIGKDNLKTRVLIDLLCQILGEPLFDQIRTKDQFGYEVYVAPRWTYGIMGISFKCVTATKSASDVEERFEQFLIDYRQILANMSRDEFYQQMIGVMKCKLQMFNSLEEECSFYWNEIIDRRYDWECHRHEVLELQQCTLQDVLDLYDTILMPTTAATKSKKGEQDAVTKLQKRRRLVVQVIGTAEGRASEGRPSSMDANDIDDLISKYHKQAGYTTWGKIM